MRPAVEGADRVPADGPALLVANRAGPLEILLIGNALPRTPRFLAGERAFALPWVSIAVRGLGGVPADAANAERLLGEGELVVASAKAGRQRYRVGRVDAEVAALALRAAVAVVPVAVVGGEDRVPLPTRWGVAFGAPLDLRSYGVDAATDRAALLEVCETIRERIQAMVYDSLVRREGAIF